jgi:hypothetical protein
MERLNYLTLPVLDHSDHLESVILKEPGRGLSNTAAFYSLFNFSHRFWHRPCHEIFMLTELAYITAETSIAAKPRVTCTRCKRGFEAGELLRCGLCPKQVCPGCAVKRYGKKFCSDHCMFYFGVDDSDTF